jgi:DNA-binding response OmpR family regulator
VQLEKLVEFLTCPAAARQRGRGCYYPETQSSSTVTTQGSANGKAVWNLDRRVRHLAVLVVDDEQHVLLTTGRLLEALQFTALLAASTSEALRIVSTTRVDVALIDWRLRRPDDGLALGRALRRDRGIPFVIFSGFMTTDAACHALRQGAADVVDKPLGLRRLVAALEFALCQRRTPDLASLVGVHCGSEPVSRRWAQLALRACHATRDPNTEDAVAIASAVSTSVFRKVCEACSVGARDTRDFIRFLRAEARAKEDGSMLRSQLAVSDPRTRLRLFQRAGLAIDSRFVPLRAFVLNQQFIPGTMECLHELAHRAANDPLFFADFNETDSR